MSILKCLKLQVFNMELHVIVTAAAGCNSYATCEEPVKVGHSQKRFPTCEVTFASELSFGIFEPLDIWTYPAAEISILLTS